MNFRKGFEKEEPEINLIPMIDVLLVIIIFLMLTTTYSRFSGIEINLPTANAERQEKEDKNINVMITAAGEVTVDEVALKSISNDILASALRHAAEKRTNPVVVINADAKTAHQRVIDVMQAAQAAGLANISFATQDDLSAS